MRALWQLCLFGANSHSMSLSLCDKANLRAQELMPASHEPCRLRKIYTFTQAEDRAPPMLKRRQLPETTAAQSVSCGGFSAALPCYIQILVRRPLACLSRRPGLAVLCLASVAAVAFRPHPRAGLGSSASAPLAV